MALRHLAALLEGLTPRGRRSPTDEAWNWRRAGSFSPALSLRHRDGGLAELRPLRPRDRIQWLGGMPDLPLGGPEAPPDPPAAGEAGRRVARRLALDPGRGFAWVLVARESDGWWGVARGELVPLADAPRLAALGVAVHPAHRGRGIGRLIVRALAASASVMGVESVRVWVDPTDARVVEFVRGFGSQVEREHGVLRCDADLPRLLATVCCPRLTAELADVTRRVEGEAVCPLRLHDAS